jgi:DNA modification methylase
MCGDSLSLTDVQKLLGGQKAEMIFTDPPYGVNYKPEERRKGGRRVSTLGGIQGDERPFPITEVMELIHTGIVNGAVYICHGTNQRDDMYEFAYKKIGFRPTDIIWVKNGFSILARDYHSAYEPIMYYYYPGKKFRGSRGQTDVWFFKRRNPGEYVHPTMKPVAMIQKAIENSSDQGDIVLDLFGGSGSTMIACEHTGRRCYMMELDAHYADIIIKRWETLTGQKAEKINELLPHPGV